MEELRGEDLHVAVAQTPQEIEGEDVGVHETHRAMAGGEGSEQRRRHHRRHRQVLQWRSERGCSTSATTNKPAR